MTTMVIPLSEIPQKYVIEYSYEIKRRNQLTFRASRVEYDSKVLYARKKNNQCKIKENDNNENTNKG